MSETLSTAEKPSEAPTEKIQAALGSSAVYGVKDTNPTKRTEFIDSRGETRRAHELAADVIITDELEEAIDEHFAAIYEELPKIDTELTAVEDRLANPEKSKKSLFDPLGEEFIADIKDKVALQMGQVTEEKTVIRERQVEQKGRFGRKKLVSEQYETAETVLKLGNLIKHVPGEAQIAENVRWFDYKPRGGGNGSEYISPEESLKILGDRISTVAERLLCDETSEHGSTLLPLLAVRLAESQVDIDELTPESLIELVPELTSLQDSIDKIRDTVHDEFIATAIGKARSTIQNLMPTEWNLALPHIYYNDSDFDQILVRYDRALAIKKAINPDSENDWPAKEELIEKAKENIETYFTRCVSADNLLFHYTPFGPRLIKSGSLKPSAAMQEDEFSFNTIRRHGDTSQEGSNGVHWSQKDNLFYDHDLYPGEWMGKDALQEYEKRRIEEMGGFGHIVVAARLGDVISRTPFGGWRNISDEATRRNPRHKTSEFTVVQLTEEGYQKVKAKLNKKANNDDIVYVAAPGSATKEEAFDYEYPVEDMMIAIGAKSKDEIHSALRVAGWSEERIEKHTYPFEFRLTNSGVEDQMQEDAYNSSKYERSVVALLRKIQ